MGKSPPYPLERTSYMEHFQQGDGRRRLRALRGGRRRAAYHARGDARRDDHRRHRRRRRGHGGVRRKELRRERKGALYIITSAQISDVCIPLVTIKSTQPFFFVSSFGVPLSADVVFMPLNAGNG